MKERLSGWQVPVRREAAERHLTNIEATLDGRPRPTAPIRPRIRRRLVYVMAALVIAILPTGAAIAAEGSVPGDFLYPVKRVTESVRSIWNSDLAAEHRIDELHVLIDRGFDLDRLTDAITDAQREVDALISDHPLRDRLTDLLESDRVTDAAPTDQAPSDAAVTDAAPADQASSTTAATDDAPQYAADAAVVAADWPPQVIDLLLVFGSSDLTIEALPDAIQEVVADILDENLDTLTGAEIDALLSYAADHPEVFGSDAAPPADPQGDGASDGSDDTTDSQGGDQPQD